MEDYDWYRVLSHLAADAVEVFRLLAAVLV